MFFLLFIKGSSSIYLPTNIILSNLYHIIAKKII